MSKQQPPRQPGKTLLLGLVGSPFVILLWPILMPLILFYYLGQILAILFGKRGDPL
jgi:hypothetical protein